MYRFPYFHFLDSVTLHKTNHLDSVLNGPEWSSLVNTVSYRVNTVWFLDRDRKKDLLALRPVVHDYPLSEEEGLSDRSSTSKG